MIVADMLLESLVPYARNPRNKTPALAMQDAFGQRLDMPVLRKAMAQCPGRLRFTGVIDLRINWFLGVQ